MADGDGPSSELDRLRAECAASQDLCKRLTYELGHRVKNTLSMAQALANQTFRAAASSQDALERFNERIVALARANDVILTENWTSPSLEAVASGVLAPRGQPVGPLTIAGPPQVLSTGAALSLALALQEMASNARRFGAWRNADGQVALDWAIHRAAEGDRFDLSWTETGGPAATVPASKGFGLRLAEQSLRSAFGPDVVFDFRPAGFQCRVSASQAALAG